jgi:hypothetical protein
MIDIIALGCMGGVANIHHQPIDTIQWISPAKLAEVVSLVADVVSALQDKTLDWCRPAEAESPSEK